MSLKQAIHHNIFNNPIVRLEATTLHRQRGKWFQWLGYFLTVVLLFAPLFWGYSRDFFTAINADLTFLVILNAIVYLVVVLKSVATANDSTYRERRGKTWELLMLTGVSNWRVVFGKWLGVMKSLSRDYLWLYVIRVGTLLWFVAQQNLYRSYDSGCLYGYAWTDCTLPTLANANFGHQFIIHACLLMLGFSVLELMASTAIGMSTAFFNWKAQTANGAAMMIRIGLGAGLPILVYFVMFQLEWNNPGWVTRNISPEMGFFGLRFITIFGDNGMIGSAFLFDNYTMETYRQIFWASNWVSMGFYGLVTILALQLAATRAFFGGISLATSIPEVKAKRMIEAAPYPRPLPSSQAHPSRLYNEHGQANVFGIKGATLRLMEIYHYQRRLGRMVLRVTGEGEPIYIQLDNVIYMEAPAFWKGANLNSATESEFRVFLNEKKLAVSSIAEDTMRLYWNEAGVRIVAGSAEVLEELPANI